MSSLNVQLLLTGNELMSGDIIDSNSAMIAQLFKDLGIEISRKVTIADDATLLQQEIESMSQSADILIINGGLGPTVDDITASILANVVNQPLVENTKALQHIEAWALRRQATLNAPNLKQTLLPKNAEIVHNRIGSAVGININHNSCEIYCTPGVPKELEIMFCEEIIKDITNKFKQQLTQGNFVDISRLHTFGIGESNLQEMIHNEIPQWSTDIELGFRAEYPVVEIKLTTRNKELHLIKEETINQIKSILNDHIIDATNERPKKLAEYVIDLLKSKEQTITIAESCTGGLISSQITEIAGSSQVFEAGFITYSNKIKSQMLDVNSKTIEAHGAVSKDTVKEMALGALTKSDADYVIAVTGIAGPTGGTPTKPLGSVWIAWGTREDLRTQYLCVKGERKLFQRTVSARSLDLIRRYILKSKTKPRYVTN